MIVAVPDTADIHPEALVTVKVYVPGRRPAIVVLVPVPAVVMLPGLRVSVQEPVGREFKTTLPVATAHVGCVIVPITGATGVAGWTLIVAPDDGSDVHPVELVTVKV